MPRFSANLSTLLQGLPLAEGVARAAEAGFDAIEFQFPYAEDARTIRAELERHEMPLVLMNFPVGDLMTGGQGLAAVPGREAEFEAALHIAREYAAILRPQAMNLLAGRPDPRHNRDECRAVFAANLKKAEETIRPLGIELLTEPVNTDDMPGFFLPDSISALALISELPQLKLRMQFDCYHAYRMGEKLMFRLPQIIEHVGHIQFSDAPGRTEPGPGEIEYPALFSLIDDLNYSGFVGAEYFPTNGFESSLGWLHAR